MYVKYNMYLRKTSTIKKKGGGGGVLESLSTSKIGQDLVINMLLL